MIPDRHLRERRKPTAAELGLDMTIGIAAITSPDRYIVAVSDHRISYDGWFPATELGARKMLTITSDRKWHLMFAANDVSLFKPVLSKIIADLKGKENVSAAEVREICEAAYSETLRNDFTRKHLSQFAYSDVPDFRKNGLGELGKDNYDKLALALYTYDLGLHLVVFGYDGDGYPSIFSVTNPGKATEMNWQGYDVVGSGSIIALSALRHKPMDRDLEGVIYRVLEAKFASETARDVGKTTTLITMNQDGDVKTMKTEEIDALRAVWQRTQKEPMPKDALNVISKSRAVTGISDGER